MSKGNGRIGQRAPALWQQIAIFAFGVVFVSVLLWLAYLNPYPTPYQYTVSRIILALAASAVATLLTGFLQVDIPAIGKAGGALAVFLIVYFYSPAALVISNLGAAQSNLDSRHYEAAKKYLDNVLIADPNNAAARNLLGTYYWKIKSPSEARIEFAKAASLATGDERDRYLFNEAAAALGLSDAASAAAVLEELAQRDPNDRSTQYNLAIAKGQLRDFAGAKRILLRLVDLGERGGKDYRANASLQLGVLSIMENEDGGVADAIRYFQRAVCINHDLEQVFLGIKKSDDAEDYEFESRFIDRIATRPEFETFRGGLREGRLCGSTTATEAQAVR